MKLTRKQFIKKLGGVIKDARHDAELTQTETARLAGVHRVTLAYMEAGKFGPSLWTLMAIARAVERDPGSLLQEALAEPQRIVGDGYDSHR